MSSQNGAALRIAAPPSPADSLNDAYRRTAHTFRADELVWVVAERYDEQATAWTLDLLRQGAEGRWMRCRYRYDAVADVLYFLGESALDSAAFRTLRREAKSFDLAAWRKR